VSAPPNACIDFFVADVFGEWSEVLRNESNKPYFPVLMGFVADERAHKRIHPSTEDTFAALQLTSPSDTRVVILGQDPYHGPGQAHGLAFSVPDGIPTPPSLRNVFAEMCSDLQCELPASGNLQRWARQGVLLLNAALTVRAGEAASHSGRGWETFTDAIVSILGQRNEHCVFVLWGRHARAKTVLIADHHTVISSSHPSPLSAHRGFLGSRPFSRTNAALVAHGQAPIDWANSSGK